MHLLKPETKEPFNTLIVMSFTKELYSETKDIQSLIINHKFPMGIGDGTLDISCFKHFIEQDYLFLIEYGKILGLATIKSPDYITMSKFSILLQETLNTEMQLHLSFCEKIGITESRLQNLAPTNATSAYTNFLVKTGYESDFPKIAAALLPCMATYAEIGTKLNSIKLPGIHPAYSEWINMYAGNEFQELAEWMTNLVNKIAEDCTEQQKQKMKTIYIYSCKFELDFWSSSLDKTRWNTLE
ncbi:MAG: thiaminase II [Chloroflexi bacterium]|jgi:thiaminase/transcriptional activator TenA|nr:thiaminase II [Chloroflexota bacterium]MDP7195477.1 thiaminase II [SAR202 cluster bacterium]|tara:strand:- start:1 stop:726 length:726 start_codon:yes stop_codon:yes gene_type:complete